METENSEMSTNIETRESDIFSFRKRREKSKTMMKSGERWI